MNQIEESPKGTLVRDARPSTYPSSWNVVFAPAAPLPANLVSDLQIRRLLDDEQPLVLWNVVEESLHERGLP
jgi:hypothetical protein